MNRTDRISVRVWMWPFWFCSSAEVATPPVRCMLSPGGAPDSAKVDRSAVTTLAMAASLPDVGRRTSTNAVVALPFADLPRSRTLVTRGMVRICCSTRSMAVSSAAVSAPL